MRQGWPRTLFMSSPGATAEMEKLAELDVLVEKIDGKLMILSQPDLTRALETIWDRFFGPSVNKHPLLINFTKIRKTDGLTHLGDSVGDSAGDRRGAKTIGFVMVGAPGRPGSSGGHPAV